MINKTRASRLLRRSALVGVAGLVAVSCAKSRQDLQTSILPPWFAGPSTTIPTFTVGSAGVIVNRYAALTSDQAFGSATLLVDSASALDAGAPFGPLGAGDLVLVYQSQGAVIDSSNTASYGRVTTRAGAGNWEIDLVSSVVGNRIGLDPACALRHDYHANAGTQVVRVPRIGTLTVAPGASITAPAWDGRIGGVASVLVDQTLTLDGAIDVTARGFRGGIRDNTSAPSGNSDTEYKSADPADGGEKGESIAGFGAHYDTAFGGRYARGAPANGGGGGTSHNGGGGGGANGDDGAGWIGDGVMDTNAVGALAWTLDPIYTLLGHVSRSAGGGRGGYSFSFSDQDALTVPPGDPAWAGNFRRDRGGHGGRPLANDPSSAIYFGGGGGAGDSNNNAGGSGGAGGGLALIFAREVHGAGTILAVGSAGESTRNGGNDGPGGGGAGGTVVLASDSGSGIAIVANGGKGGDQSIATLEAEGPGGGGGGGFIAIAGVNAAKSALGGVNGTTNSQSLTEFPANGATLGAKGDPDGIADPLSLPICLGAEPLFPQYDVAGSGGCAISPARRGAAWSAFAALLMLVSIAAIARRRRA